MTMQKPLVLWQTGSRKSDKNEKLHDYLARERIIWKFNLSKAPWWGAMYERLIRDLKRTFLKSLEEHISPGKSSSE